MLGFRKDAPVYEPGQDVRLDFVYGLITRSLRIKPDKWKAFLITPEFKSGLFDFFDNPNTTFFVLYLDEEGFVQAANTFPAVSKTKSVYLMKKTPTAIPNDDLVAFQKDMMIGELPPQPLDGLTIFVEDIIRPIITAEVNQDKWPESVVTDLKKQTEEICSILYTIQGQLRGKTLLPMPINIDLIEENERRMEQGGPGEVDLALRMSLETLTIKWNQQISEVLQLESSKPLKDGLNPSPYVELAFWEERVEDLKAIYAQLNEDKVRKLANILEKTNSTYWPCFKSMFRNVVAALAEAQDILGHLNPLRKILDTVQTTEFENLANELEPLMQHVCHIWGKSRYYCSPGRIIVLLEEICNLLISRAHDYVDSPAIFKLEPEEGKLKADILVETLQLFRNLYQTARGELPVYFSKEAEAKSWDFLPHLVFTRYDKFLDRMKKLQELFETSAEFYKLDNVDIGGRQGKYCKQILTDLHKEYQEFYKTLSNIEYDCGNPEDDSFDADYEIFKEKADGIDKRLSAIVSSAVESSDTPESIFNLFTNLGEILDRPIVRADFELHYPIYVAKLDQSFATIKELYDKTIVPYPVPERTQIFEQYPPYSASVYWAKKMKERIDEDMANFKSLELILEDKESVELLNDKYTELTEILQQLQDSTYNDWKTFVENESDGWLKENLLGTEEEDGSIVVNFNKELCATIKEVHFMQKAGYKDIPSVAKKIFTDRKTFRNNLGLLDEIADSYNKILGNANQAEREVLKGKLKQIDSVLKDSKQKMTWSDSGNNISDYVQKLRDPVADMLNRFQESQENIVKLRKLVQQWISKPIYERKSGGGDQLLSMDSKARQRKEQHYKLIEDSSVKIHDIVAKNKELLNDSNIPENTWRSYLTYIDEIVTEAIIRSAGVSIGYLADHTDPALTPGPLFEIVMELDDSGPLFIPSLEFSQSDSFMNLIEDIIQDIFFQGTLVRRVKPGTDNYLPDLESAQNLSEMINDIKERANQVLTHTKEYIQRFQDYAHIWENDKNEYLSQVLKYGRQLSQEEVDAKFAGVEIAEKEPTLDQFQELIDKFEKLYLEVERFPPETVIDQWFRLNMRGFRQSLLNNCKHWSLLFKQYLMDHVVNGLQELEKFLQDVTNGLNQRLKEGDTKTLIAVMKRLQQVKERQSSTDNMFDPIKEYIELLKVYEYEIPDKTNAQLDQLPQKWTKVKKLAVQVKHQVGPLVVKEVAAIRGRITDFDKKQNDYRNKFKTSEFFDKECTNPYPSINKTYADMQKLEKVYEELRQQAELFEVIIPEPRALRMCPREIRLAKNIWDCIFIVESCLEDWKTTPWQAIITEAMSQELVRLRKEAKTADVDLNTWTIFTTLETLSKNNAIY